MTALDDALNAGGIVWAGTRVRADWRGDGIAPMDTYPLRDTFEGKTVTNGFGVADTGQAWKDSGTTQWSVAGGVGLISISTLNSSTFNTIGYNSGNGYDVVTAFSTPALATGAQQMFGVLVNYNSITNHHAAWFFINTDQTITWSLRRRNNNTLTVLTTGTVPGVTHAANRILRVRVQMFPALSGVGNTLRFRMWVDGAAEPTSWMSTTTDTLITWTGQCGVFANLQTGNTNATPFQFSVYDFTNVGITNLYTGGASFEQSLDNGMPTEVTDAGATGIPAFKADLVPPLGFPDAASYYSVFRPDSPVYGIDRDVAAVTADVGVVTATGIQQTRMFTGVMGDIPTDAASASLEAVSATRNKLRTQVQPPAVDGAKIGCNALFPVSYALWKSGVKIMPWSLNGNTRLLMPMHGSMQQYVPDKQWEGALPAMLEVKAGGSIGSLPAPRPTFIQGPFSGALFCELTAAHNLSMTWTGFAASQYQVFPWGYINSSTKMCQTGFWVRGDAADVANAPGGSGNVTHLAGIHLQLTNGYIIKMGLDNTRHAYVSVFDGTNTSTLQSAGTLPTDGAWHFVGAFYDLIGNNLQVALDAVVGTATPSPAISTTLATNETWAGGYPKMVSYLPISEIQHVTGPGANPNSFGWIRGSGSVVAGAITRPMLQELRGSFEPSPREAYELITSLAVAELAWTGFDVNDVFQILPLSYWAEPAQQTTAETLSTDFDLGTDLLPRRDVTKIYNQIGLTYKDTQVDQTKGYLYAGSPGTRIDPGSTVVRIPFTTPAASILFPLSPLFAINASGVAAAQAAFSMFIQANTAPDGSGTEANTNSDLVMTPQSWDAGGVTVLFANFHTTPYYLVNANNGPSLGFPGYAVRTLDNTVTSTDTDSYNSARGPRLLTMSLPGIQSYGFATSIAGELVARLARPRTSLTVSAVADPRRAPGWLVKVTDRSTGINGLFRLTSVATSGSAGDWRQTLTAEEAWLVALWDSAIWGQSIWGP